MSHRDIQDAATRKPRRTALQWLWDVGPVIPVGAVTLSAILALVAIWTGVDRLGQTAALMVTVALVSAFGVGMWRDMGDRPEARS